MNAKLLSTSFATFALLCSGVAAGEAPAEDARPKILLQADSSELGKRGTGLDKIMLDRLGPALETEGIDTTGSILNLGVRVRVVPVDMGAIHYSILFEIEKDDMYTQVLGAVDCKPCTDATLLEKIDSRAPALADLIKERSDDGQAPDGATTEGGDDSTTGEEGGEDTGGDGDVEPEPQTRPIGALGYAGIETATLGLGATIAGAVELSRGVVIESFGNEQRNRIDHRPPGIALVGVGATALAVGLVILGVDLGVRAKKRKARTPRDQARLFPIIIRDSVGLGVSGAF